MIVEGERSDAVEDLVEEILRMDLLHDLPVDAIAHAEEPIAVDPVNRGRQDRGDARDQASILPIERAGPDATSAIAPQAPPRRRTDPISMSRCTGGWVWRM